MVLITLKKVETIKIAVASARAVPTVWKRESRNKSWSCEIIVEYNPFHTGHLYHLQKAKEMVKPDLTIAIMSGNYVQRGEVAIIDKLNQSLLYKNNRHFDKHMQKGVR